MEDTAMNDGSNVSSGKLLYDPMFAKKNGLKTEKEKQSVFKPWQKALFIAAILLFVGTSVFLSFGALKHDKYEFDKNGEQNILTGYHAGKDDGILSIDFVCDDEGNADLSAPVNGIRKFALCCDEFTELIYLGKDVTDIETNGLYYCTNLLAVIVDPQNPSYCSEDGVLYTKDKSELILHPERNAEYRTACTLDGFSAPETKEDAEAFLALFNESFPALKEDRSADIQEKVETTGAFFTVPSEVRKIGDGAFSYCSELKKVTLPDGLKEVAQMGFFKCGGLEEMDIPDTLETIGPDGFSYCEKLTYLFVPASVKTIGHHAFFGCLGLTELDMGAQEKDGTDIGESWLPKINKKSLKTIPVNWGQERRGE